MDKDYESSQSPCKDFYDALFRIIRPMLRTEVRPSGHQMLGAKTGERVFCIKDSDDPDKNVLIYGTVLFDQHKDAVLLCVKEDDGSEKMWSVLHTYKVTEEI
jgi:hypothetical protein